MENKLIYFVNGRILIITKDEGERPLHYAIRVKFILDRFNIFPINDLETYSRIYINYCFYNLTYPTNIFTKLQGIVNHDINASKVGSSTSTLNNINMINNNLNNITRNNSSSNNNRKQSIEKFKEELVDQIVEDATSEQIVFENGAILEPVQPLQNNIEIQSSDDHFTGPNLAELNVILEVENQEPLKLEIEDLNELQPAVLDVTDKTIELDTTNIDELNIVEIEPNADPSTMKLIVENTYINESNELENAPIKLTTANGVEIVLEPLPEELLEEPQPLTEQIPEVIEDNIDNNEVGVVQPPLSSVVKFLNSGDENGYLTLEYNAKININGKEFNNALEYCVYLLGGANDNDNTNTNGNGREIGKLKSIVSKSNLTPEVMKECNYQKFAQNPDLKDKLLATDNQEIIYDNDNDNYWGKNWGVKSDNVLGKILMTIRDELKVLKDVYLKQENLQPEIVTMEEPIDIPEPRVEKIIDISANSEKKLTGAEIRTLLRQQEDKNVILDDIVTGDTDVVMSDKSETLALLKSGQRIPYERIVAINGKPVNGI